MHVHEAFSNRHPIRTSRRSLLRGVASLAVAGSLLRMPTSAFAEPSGPDQTIERFYLDLATYDYDHAYALLGGTLRAKQSRDAFTKGYADTAYVQVKILGDRPSSEGTDVEVALTSWHNDASIHAYQGRYSVAQAGDGWQIVAASIAETTAPADVAPLIRIDDATFALGQGSAGAGHRYLDLQVTNTSSRTVFAAGVPRLAYIDDAGAVILASTSAQGDPFTAVTLAPGDTAHAMFEWWINCTDIERLPISLQIAVPGDTLRATIPFSEALGLDGSSCQGPNTRTVLTAKAFQTAP